MWKAIAGLRSSPPLCITGGFILAALTLAAIGSLVTAGLLQPLDDFIGRHAQNLHHPVLTDALRLLTRFGSTLVLIVLGMAAVILFVALRWGRELARFLLAMAGQAILHHGFKAIFSRERPATTFDYVIDDPSYSFPSGHAIASMAFYGIVAWTLSSRMESRTLRPVVWLTAGIVVLLVGFSRVYFGLHHASDVIAGYLAASIWIASIALCSRSQTSPVMWRRRSESNR